MPARVNSPHLDELRARLPKVPREPGVYLMRDRISKVIYVGKAKDLRSRLSYYFRPTKQTLGNLKTRALIEAIVDFEFHTVRSETEALLLEGKLIKEFRPRYNVEFRDDKRFMLLKLRRDVPFPRFELVRQKKADDARYFGPFVHAHALRGTVDWLNRRLGLRTCRPLRPGETDYKHCSADVIRNCSAPCVRRVGEGEYQAKIEQAVEILTGKDKSPLQELEAEMAQAAVELDFERAALMRDVRENLLKTMEPVRRFTRGRGASLSASNAEEELRELQGILRLPHLPLVMECFDISNVSSTYAVASMVRFVGGKPDNQGYRRYRIKTVTGQNDFAAMAEVVKRRYLRILQEKKKAEELGEEPSLQMPDLIVVDGGKGQLSSAYEELQRLGQPKQAMIGLAKQEEEIHRPGVPEPLLLPHDRPALKLLQRLRDEAHRTANGYHQLLAQKRVRESALDGIEGLGPKRKAQLLREFGSVARIRKAGVEGIAALNGFSAKRAEEILAALGVEAESKEEKRHAH